MNPTLTTYFLHILQGEWSNAQVLIFRLNSLREAEFFNEFGRKSHNLVAREERLSLSRDKQYYLDFFLMYNRSLNYKVFPQNGKYHSSFQVTHQF